MKDLAGRTVLITGASSGIGWAAALAFARRGCRVGLAARRIEKIEELGRAILQEIPGTEILPIQCDIRDRKQAAEAVEAVVRRWERIDILINNAGIASTLVFARQEISLIEDIMKTNYLGSVYALHAALPHMSRRKEGHVVNIASIAGIVGVPGMAAYCASKFALVGLTEALRREYYGSGIGFTAFCPGIVDTPMAAQAVNDPKYRKRFTPKTAPDTAEKIIETVLNNTPEFIYGEYPGVLLKLTKFFPALFDWATHRAIARIRPDMARSEQ